MEQLRQSRQCQRREQFSHCRGKSMLSSCRSLEAKRGGGAVGEMVCMDPGSEPRLKVRVRNLCY